MLKALVAGLIASETSALYVENSSTDARSQTFSVPIDEKKALSLTVSPNYNLDTVNSVTLKAFRKIIGYDTFESIRKKDRSEVKDSSDYYNVTVSMMIRREPAAVAAAPRPILMTRRVPPASPPRSTRASPMTTEQRRCLAPSHSNERNPLPTRLIKSRERPPSISSAVCAQQ